MALDGLVANDIKVLIVDDFKTMRTIVRNLLSQLGFANFLEAQNGKEAYTLLENNNVQLIISDWNMPEMMGIDLLRAVRANEKMKSIPFLMVTAESEQSNVIAAVQAGVSNYVVKPFNVTIVEDKLKAIFEKQKA